MPSFTLRVYGVLINEQKEVLVADEYIRGGYYTKFPGGGLEFGEGTRDCLKREFLEEMNLQVEVLDHIYTTDFFQISAFNSEHQIVSVFYYVKALEEIKVPLRNKPFDFDKAQLSIYEKQKEIEAFRFIPWNELNEETVNLPIEKVVIKMIKDNPPTHLLFP